MFKQIQYAFDELEFEGFRFTGSHQYTREYFDKLLEDGSHYSKVKFLEGFNDQFIISIHCKLSYYYLCVFLALVSFSLAVLLLFKTFLLTAAILFVLSFIFWIISRLFFRSAGNEKMSMAMNGNLIDMLFEERKKEMEGFSVKTDAGDKSYL